MAHQLEYAKTNSGSVSYLSPKIQNEFIGLLTNSVRNSLVAKIKKNKYYGILLDSTPDVAHREKLSFVVRFVDVDLTKIFDSRIISWGFTQLLVKDAATLETIVMENIKAYGLSLADCRSQCYDNAAVMAGQIAGLQQRIAVHNPKALFVNCDNHSLNLAGAHAAKQDPPIVTFFGTINSIYKLFSVSTIRWQQLKDYLPITVKRESETRWSYNMSDDAEQTHETRNEADRLLQNYRILSSWYYCIFGMLYFRKLIESKKDYKTLQ